MRKAVKHLSAVMTGILFIGFTVQILLGIVWMCRRFLGTQDFGEPDSTLYRGIFRLVGENCQIMYLLQLGLAFYGGYRFLMLYLGSAGPDSRRGRLYAVWGSLAVLTVPFAMQCHLAIQPYSFMGSLFLFMLSLFVEMLIRPQHFRKGKKGQKRKAGFLAAAILCAALMTLLSGVADRHEGEPAHSLAAAMARRTAWPDVWEDFEYWPEDLREITGDIAWKASLSVENMKTLEVAIEDSVGKEAAEEYYWKIAEIGWMYHSSAVIHRIAWDIVAYTVTPIVISAQLEGRLFDSYTGRNYEVMRAGMPVFTKYYVEYYCWWFGWCLFLTAGLVLIRIFTEEGLPGKRTALAAGVCILAAGILALLFTMRGAGMMDYKCTIAVNALWLLWALIQMRGCNGSEKV